MTTVRQILRCMHSLGQVSKSGTKVSKSFRRCASASTQSKFVEGGRGERILPSPDGQVTYPELPVQEYVWRNIKKYPNQIALECGVSGRKYTFNEARDATNYIARSLLNLGLAKGDTVALMAPNYPETVLGFLGILEAELVVTTVNPFYTLDEISRQLKSSGAKAVITVSEIAATAISAAKVSCPPGTPMIVIEDGVASIPEGTIPFKDLISRGKSLPLLGPQEKSLDDLAILPYSSGTTGLPKGVMLSHRNLVSNMEMIDHSSDNMWRESTETFQEIVPLMLPFFHIFGMNGVTLPRLSAGTKIVTIPKFTPDVFVSVLEKEKVTGLYCVPPIILFMAASPLVKKSHVESMHMAVSGAAPLAKADVERFYERFNIDASAIRFCQGYGLTECSPVSCLETTGKKFGSIGKNIAGCDVRLVDPITNEDIASPGQTGELWVKGPHIMKGYLNNETATRDTIVDNTWLKTGDIAYFDEDFDFFITDRLKELIKVKGFQVPPAELEALLRTHPDVQEAAVIGIPDDRRGEVPRAFVLAKDGKKPSEEEIKNFVKGKVSEYKELRGGVAFVNAIPKNQSGKILRAQLKAKHLS